VTPTWAIAHHRVPVPECIAFEISYSHGSLIDYAEFDVVLGSATAPLSRHKLSVSDQACVLLPDRVGFPA
jgi:hypothetical protein